MRTRTLSDFVASVDSAVLAVERRRRRHAAEDVPGAIRYINTSFWSISTLVTMAIICVCLFAIVPSVAGFVRGIGLYALGHAADVQATARGRQRKRPRC